VVESTGLVVIPYMQYPQLLAVLLRILSEGSPRARMEVVKVSPALFPCPPHHILPPCFVSWGDPLRI
jgi:serine/threonine-protein kinase mTOR